MLADTLAIIAIILSASSLYWQVTTWRRSGAVITVTTGQAMPTYGADVGDPHVSITAANKGRSPVTVNNWGLKLPDGRRMAITHPATWSSPIPYRLEPGSSAAWYVLTSDVKNAAAENGVRYQDLIAWVTLGDGREIDAREPGIFWK